MSSFIVELNESRTAHGNDHPIPTVSCGILAALFPPGVSAAQFWDEGGCRIPLHAEEARCVERAAAARIREFAAGRLCARHALGKMGITDFPLLAQSDRAPCWPSSVVGSITHAGGYYAAVAAERKEYRGIGVDAEVLGRVESCMWDDIFTAGEIEWLHLLAGEKRLQMATVIFSAKEAFYKCQYCITRQWLDFKDIALRMGDGCFVVDLLRRVGHPLAGQSLEGKFLLHRGLVLTGISLAERDGGGARGTNLQSASA